MTEQVVYGLVYDLGDGSATVTWHDSMEEVDDLTTNVIEYYMNEGSPAVTISMKDGRYFVDGNPIETLFED